MRTAGFILPMLFGFHAPQLPIAHTPTNVGRAPCLPLWCSHPFMTSNLAQILRTWVSFGLLQGNVIIPTFTSSTTAVEAPPNISIPAYLFSWTHSSTPTQPPRSSLTCKEKRQPKPKPTPSHASLSSTGPNLNKRPLSSCCGNTVTASPSPQHFKTGKSFQRTLYDTFNITSPEH